ncbi:MAG: tyrocidine synthetase-3, partial [Crocinitomix sp.]
MTNTVDFILELSEQDVKLYLEDGKLKVNMPKGNVDPAIIQKIKSYKGELITYLSDLDAATATEVEVIDQAENYAISSAQRRLWVLSQFENGSAAYNIPGSIYFNQNMDIACFKKAIDATIKRHEILRTVFKKDQEGEIKQWVLSLNDLGFQIEHIDYRDRENKDELVQHYIAEDSIKAFNLEDGPLLRASLLQVEDDGYVFYYNMHHIISDGWSAQVLSKDVFTYYRAFKENGSNDFTVESIGLKALRIQYKDYATWETQELKSDKYKTHKTYWLDQLSGKLPTLDLPSTLKRPRLKTNSGRVLGTYLSKATSFGLQEFSKQNDGTLFMGILASLDVLFYRYTTQNDIIIGSPIAGRENTDLENQIGFYANTLALRNQVEPSDSFKQLFEKVKQNMLAAYAHQMYPFDKLVEELDLARDTSRNAVFDVMLVLQNNGESEPDFDLSFEEQDQIVDQGPKTSKFDLLINFREEGQYISISVEYNSDVYEKTMIENFIRHYKTLALKLVSNPLKEIGKVAYLSAPEQEQLLVDFNETAKPYQDHVVMELFESQVEKTPDNIALEFEGQMLTYRELNERTNQLAHFLKDTYHIGRTEDEVLTTSSKVGVMIERSAENVIAMIAIMKTGACYVPIDHEYPTDRVAFIIKDAKLDVIISETEFFEKHGITEKTLLNITALNLEGTNKANLPRTTVLNDGAFVIYTSGSTGIPKGVVQTHRMLSNLIQWELQHSGIERGLKHLQYTSFSFDVSLQDCWAVLSAGGVLCVANKQIRIDFPKLWDYIISNEIQVLSFPYSAFQQLIIQNAERRNEAHQIRYIISSGEQLIVNVFIQKFLETTPKLELHNHYGPSETHVVTNYRMSVALENIANHASIGQPVSNTEIYILDNYQKLVPQGVVGELYIGGENLALGYLNQAELTNEKFINSPFKNKALLYKTGDLGRWLPDGNIEYIGRKDDQIKIRGYRIELGEIANALSKNESIEAAVVIARELNQPDEVIDIDQGLLGELELVAYITASTEQNTSELRAYLKELLPEYMVPSYYVQLDKLPLTRNGKVDKRALPSPEGLGLSSGVEYVAPSNEIEEQLVAIWENVLQQEKVGIKDDFFELGGHSLKAIKLINEYQKIFEVKLSINQLFLNTSLELHGGLIQAAGKTSFIEIPIQEKQANYPISDAQRRLWVLSQFEDGSAAYNMPSQVYLNQEINIDNFTKAINNTIERHEILRTVFREDADGTVKQWILEKAELGFEITYQDFRNKQDQVQAYVASDSFKLFNLESGPLFRIALLQIEDNGYVFYYNMHHIISDGWSMDVLSKDVFTYYEAYQLNKKPELKELRIQYKDYSAWQLNQLAEDTFQGHQNYWLNHLSGELPLLDLPSAKQRPIIKTNNGHGLETYLDKATTSQLKKHAQQNGGSLFMSLLASWNILFYRYTAQKDIIIGTPIAGRDHANLEDQIGCYINTLALRNELSSTESFNDFYQKLKANTLASYSHQMYPFDRLVEELDLQRDTSRSAVFDVMLTLQNAKEDRPEFEIENDELNEIVEQGFTVSKFDLDITFHEVGDYLAFNVLYNPDVYEKQTIAQLIVHYRQLMTDLLAQPDQEIGLLNFLSPEEKHELLIDFNQTKVDYPQNQTSVDLFETQVQVTPNHIAVVFDETELTYQELNEKANQLAHFLNANYAIQADDLIGIELERSEWMLIGILAVLKSGGAYVPIDPTYPQDRINYIQKDANCKVILDQNELVEFMSTRTQYSTENSAIVTDSNNLAYVIYTSGSTGNPKGVMINHASLHDYTLTFSNRFEITPKDVIIQQASISFDVAVEEIFPTICSGAKLVIVAEGAKDIDRLAATVKQEEATLLSTVPMVINELNLYAESLSSLRILISGGDELKEAHISNIWGTTEIYNTYGPTEATVCATYYKIDELLHAKFIGFPIVNREIYILDEQLQLVQKGMIGEICIGGAGLAKGYLNQAELTNEKFVKNPFKPGERLYKTGDLGKWNADGNIAFLGRKDDQVKIRGYRIELGEIEYALSEIEQIDQAIVLTVENENFEKELVAYFTANEVDKSNDTDNKDLNQSELRAELKTRIPEYMLPAYFVQLDTFSLTPNGKVDKRALPNPNGLGLKSGTEYLAPRNALEIQLVAIWEKVLQREKIGVLDDFFMQGGHSLKAVRLSNEYKKVLGVKLTLKELFVNTSIATHVNLIEIATISAFTEIPALTTSEEEQNKGKVLGYSISDAQRRLWVLSQFDEGATAYNMPSHIYLDREIEIEYFKAAILATIERHEILRTVFKESTVNETSTEPEVRQWIVPTAELGFEITTKDFRLAAEDGSLEIADNQRVDAFVKTYIAEDSHQPFDLEKGPLLRAALLQTENQGYVFYYNMHHIISDGWSMEVLAKDVFTYYEAFKNKEDINVSNANIGLEKLRIQYKDYAAWQRGQLALDAFEVHKAYWLDNLSGELPVLNLPNDKQRPRTKTYRGNGLMTYLDQETSESLNQFSTNHGGTLFMGLLASWKVLMYHYTAQTDLIIGTPVAGREHADLENQIGFYVNTLALRDELNPEDNFTNFFEQLKENTLQSYNHQMYPFDRLVEDLNLYRDTSRSAVFDVMLILQNTGERSNDAQAFQLPTEQVNQIRDIGFYAAKFDLDITFEEVGGNISFHIVFNTDVYEQKMITGLMQHYKQLLAALLAQPTASLGKIDFLSNTDKKVLLETFNDTRVPFATDKTIIDLFTAQVNHAANNTAIVFENKQLTYGELDEVSSQLAHYLLQNHSVQSDDLIGIKLERSEWMPIAILAVLKTGAAYVPIDPTYPQTRIDYIEKDANCLLSIDQLELDQFIENQATLPTAEIPTKIHSNNLAYVIYTSGSTGNPKGVMVEHDAVLNTIQAQIKQFNITTQNKALQFASFSFDASVWETFIILLGGGQLFIADDVSRKDPDLLVEFIRQNEIDFATLSPSFLNKIDVAQLKGLSQLITAGEAADFETAQNFLKFGTYYNAYGPTETSVCGTIFKVEKGGDLTLNPIPIGQPIANATVYLLNEQEALLPTNVIGEICIGGPGLARGYLNQDELTAQKFIKAPFLNNQRLYKTGDLGRWLPNGDLQFIGRKDDQVKIRGHRIELGEIETSLAQHEDIEQVVVLAMSFNDSDNSNLGLDLVAYFAAKNEQNSSDLRSFLKGQLPEHMLPTYFVQLADFPLTSHGKIDKKALPHPKEAALGSAVNYVAPHTEMETDLVAIWQSVLQREKVGINDDFFDLGGHSIKAIKLISEYHRAFNVKLSISALFINTTLASHANLLLTSTRENFISIAPSEIQKNYGISDAQRRLWILSQFEDGSIAYNMPGNLYLDSEIDITVFKQAINAVIERHEILRTVFKSDDQADSSNEIIGEIKQWVLTPNQLGFEVDYVDFRAELVDGKPTAARSNEVAAYIAKDELTPFNLETGPLFRAALLQVNDRGYVFYYNMHHIISDGWSMNVLSKDIFAFYEAFKAGEKPSFAPLRIQYRDYTLWQQEQLDNDAFKMHQSYWLSKLSGELPLLALPTAKQRPIIKTHNGHGISTYIDAETTSELKKYSKENGGSLFMGVLTVWNILMHRYSAQNDIIIGSPVAGRDHSDLENQIGFYVNTLALRNKINPTDKFQTLYKQIKENTLNSFGHQMYPFDRLVDDLDLQRDTSRSAVFDVFLTLQNVVENDADYQLTAAEIVQVVDGGPKTAKFDLDVTFQEVGDYMSISLVYNSDLYANEMMQSLITHFKELLKQVLKNPEQSISELNFLTADEVHHIAVTLNDNKVAYPTNQTIVDLFEAQTQQTPNSIAVLTNEQHLTYRQLNEQANQLAHYLQLNYKLQPDDLVSVKLERNEWMIVVLLGILKSGAAYVPIDLNYPQERIDYIEQDAECKVSFDQNELTNFLNNSETNSKENAEVSIQGNQLSHIIYTSGSTGNPKGVMVEHKNTYAFIKWTHDEFKNSDFEEVLFTTSLNFDLSIFEIFHPLTAGKSVRILQDGLAIIENIDTDKKLLVNTVPSVVGSLLQERMSFDSITVLNMAGEPIPTQYKTDLAGKVKEIRNLYGPSEDTTYSTMIRIDQDQRDLIGKPIFNTDIYILNEGHQVQPIAVIGEICIAGLGITRGYLNQTELTAEKFITNPFNDETRLYKTGDLGRWLPDGNIEFLGRKDDQVKIRGYRIELGEIEHVLSQNKAIDQLVVIARDNANNEKELVAYLTSSTQVNANELREYLKGRLPAYMIPLYFVELDELPLTPNGKIDKRVLPSPEGLGLSGGIEYLAPRNEVEEQLVAIWEKVLQKENIGIKDDFFMLGGHSLKAIRLINEYQKAFEVKLSINELFLSTHLEGHSELIQTAGKTSFIEIPVQEKQANYAISDAQRRLWVLSQFEAGSAAYNMPDQVYLNQEINIENFTKAINATIERHEILRTVFKADTEGEVKQWILEKSELNFEITYHDFRNDQDQVNAYIANDSFKPFDLENGPLFRIALLQVEDNGYVFYYNMHHIISDGWSMNVLSKDVFAYYEAYEFKTEPQLNALRIQYKDYAAWQLSQLEEEILQGHKNYWLNNLSGELPLLDLPSTQQRPIIKSNNGHGLETYLDKAMTVQLKKHAQQNGGSLFMTLLATWNVLFHHYSGQEDIIIGTPIAGRDHVDLEAQIGCYINTLALRNEVKSNEGFNEFYEKLKANTLASYSHQMYPFDRLIEDLDLYRDTSRSAVFDVMLTLQNAEGTTPAMELNTNDLGQIIDQGAVKSKF